MEVIHGLERFPSQRVPVIVALGTFDGVHLGHQVLIRRALERARERGGRCVVLTFDPHPLQVIAAPAEPFLLTTIEERVRLLAGLGVDMTVVVRFDEAFRQTTADGWIEMLVHRTRLTEALCGPSYTFGRNRTGDAGMLLHVGRGRGVAVHIVQPVKIEGTIVSSTVIRRLLREGGVRDAARLLGRWYGIGGAVVQGDGRGRSLGFPTANLMLPGQKVTPAAGIYAAFSRTPAGVHRAAVSIGTRPTFGPGRLVIEAHLLDVSEDLYGAEIELYFVDRLRDEMTFASVDELVRQMHDDVSQTRRLLQRHAMPFTPIEA